MSVGENGKNCEGFAASLGVVEVSDAYQNELSKRADLELIDESRPLAFDVNWNLTPF